MNTIVTSLVIALLAGPVMAQQKAQDHSTHHPATASSVTDMAEGEIRKVDKEQKKLTIKHGEIKNLDMPPMTMVFQVKDVTLLDKLQAGDKVRFVAEKAESGYVVTNIQPAR